MIRRNSLLLPFVWQFSFIRRGFFFHGAFRADFIRFIEYSAFLSLPPLIIRFCRLFLKEYTLFSRDDILSTSLFGIAVGLSFFAPLYHSPYLQGMLNLYVAYVILLGYLSLIDYIRRRAVGVERRRMRYLAIALSIAAVLSAMEIFYYFGTDFPPLSNLVIAALLYFILLIIAYPHLTQLHELMAKTLVVTVVTAFAVVLFYMVIGLFSEGTKPPFTLVLLACFTIVISIAPFKIILEKIFQTIYPGSKDVFTSLYDLDAKLEKERALLLEEMAPVFAHEIRNPLGSIKGAAQYLRSEAEEGESRRLLDVIIEEVDRLNSVVSRFLDYAKPHTLNMKLQDINHIIEKTFAVIRASSVSGNIAFELDLNPHTPHLVVDAEQLIQVILNISFNAIDAMPDGGTLRVGTSKILSDMGDAAAIIIQDTGCGIKKDDMKNIFKPFFTTKERGVGLGLAICQRIIKEHGGYIRVKSTQDRGSVFFIRLRGLGTPLHGKGTPFHGVPLEMKHE